MFFEAPKTFVGRAIIVVTSVLYEIAPWQRGAQILIDWAYTFDPKE